jgi:hypothetical protein
MNVTRLTKLLALVAIATTISSAHAAFIVEPRSGGKAFANFSTGGDTGVPSTSTANSTAPGLTALLGSIFGGASTTVDQYLYSYTPGTNADNTAYAAALALGNGNLATGLTGGGTGLYKVYATWPSTANISNQAVPVNYTATGDGSPAVLNQLQDTDVNGGIGSSWVLIGTVHLTAGTTYTVTQTAGDSAFVSMRSAGVMWEIQAPEPASCGLAGLAALGLLAVRRRG